MSKKPKPSVRERLKPFVTPFRFDGTGEFHLKSCKTGERGGLDKEDGEKSSTPTASGSAIFRSGFMRRIAGRCS